MATYALKILISNVYILFVTLCFVLRIQSTFLNIEELQKSKYGVEISALPVLLNNQVIKIMSSKSSERLFILLDN
jgi:hypothetical protein